MTATAFPAPVPPAEPVLKRCAIMGTAQSWRACPFHDKGLHIFGLNDAYVLGYPRADAWFDLHPPTHWMSYDKAKPPKWSDIPIGSYLRPVGHAQWLKTRPIPVFLHEARKDWPTSVTFPKDDVLAFWKPYWPLRLTRKGQVVEGKDYEASSPAWMYMWAVMQGYREIGIYGIHLSTEWEYLRQRPNLEYLMGVGAGLGVKHILPDAAPICKGTFTYGYEPKDDVKVEPAQRRLQLLQQEQQGLTKRIAKAAWWDRAYIADQKARLAVVQVELMDAKQELSKVQIKVA